MVKFWVICAIAIKLVAGEMSLSEFPCYKPKPVNYRMGLKIVGGTDAIQTQTPYMVGLMRHGGIVCGASIISERVLILAAHCICNNQNKVIKPTQLKVFLGMNKLSEVKSIDENKIDEGGISEVFISKIVVHPGYVCGKKAENDIALLHLKDSIKFNQNIQPLCLSTEDPPSTSTATVTGWGWTNEDFSMGEKSDTLQTADVPIWENEDCQSSYRGLSKPNKISEKNLCAGGRDGGVDSCWADSGSPLILANGNLVGIVSTGVGCARKGLPGIYTRVSRYVKWIESASKM